MAMGTRSGQTQDALFVVTADLPSTAGHPFYEKLNVALRAIEFDRRLEAACERFYDEKGRRGIPPGVYFRMLLIGYFEGIDSERGIAWRVADSLSLRRFLGYALTEDTPEHSTLSRIRHRLSSDAHNQAFRMVLQALVKAKLVKGKTIGVDSTTLEANAAMRSIVRRDTGQSYDEYLKELARQSGIEEPTRADLAKLDKKRKKKGSNDDWQHPHDPDARITKMKDGRTHLAHKAEHVVDMSDGSCGALLGVSLHEANRGDTTTGHQSVEEAFEHLGGAIEETDELPPGLFDEVVTDKGYHSNDSLLKFGEQGLRTQVSEPDRGRRRWKNKADAKQAVYANRRRVRSERGKRLQRERGEKLERSNAHLYETGGMRRTHLRGHTNILKRLIVHAAGYNLGLLMRALFGIGKPKQLQDASEKVISAFLRAWLWIRMRTTAPMLDWLTRGLHQCPSQRSTLTMTA
jgi:transposase